MPESHVVTVIVEGQQVDGWQSGNVESSILTPADKFVLRTPFTLRAWNTLRRDARTTILVDGTTLLDGFIEKRVRHGKAGVLEVSGRDRVGRLCDESAPSIDYSGMLMLEAIRRLASPWFSPDQVVISNARNRRLRRGKGKRIAASTEPVVTINVRVPRRGQVHPGESRWHLIHEIASRNGYIVFSSADGKELVVGLAHQSQEAQYLFYLGEPGDPNNNVKDLTITEDDGDRFSLYLCSGVGGQGDTNYGANITDNRGVAFDNPFNRIDGTGRDFIHPKRMALPERAFDSYDDADRVARNEQARRDYKRHIVSAEMATMGQALGSDDTVTLFSPDTVGRVVDTQAGIDDKYYIASCSYSFNRDNGDFTTCHMVPVGTEIVL